MKKKADRKKRILVVVAHPDDEVLGCGGTIAKHAAAGDRVWVLILGEGVRARAGLSEIEKTRILEQLKKDARRANKALGVERLILKDFPDNKFDSVSLLDIVHTIEEVMQELKPTIIYTHHYSDVNIDHRRTREAIEAAVRPLPAHSLPLEQVFASEIPSSTEWSFGKDIFSPNVFVALDKKLFQKKWDAMKEYTGEIRVFPHPRSKEYLEALAKVRGGQSGFPLAEAFELVYWRR